MSAKQAAHPHERRVQRHAFVALAGAVVVGAILVLTTDDLALLRIEVPRLAPLALLALGTILGAVGVGRRSNGLTIGAIALLVLGVLPATAPRPGVTTYAIGLLFGLALLLLHELVHMTERYHRAHRAVEHDNVPEEHINRVTDEALRTLATRGGFAALAAALAVAVAFLLSLAGPAQWRAAVETSAPLGVAVIGLALAGAASLFILARGAIFRLRREPTPKELLPDVAE